MEQLTSKTLAQIVTENHQAAIVFEKYGLDFCCKGKRSLETACAEKNLAVEKISTELHTLTGDKKTGTVDFEKFSLTELVDHIVSTHHAYVKQQMPLIYAYLQKVATKHGERHPELYKIFTAFRSLREELESHMDKEEMILFPRIVALERSLADNSGMNINFIQGPVTVMEHEHDIAGKLLEEIKTNSDNYTAPADACTTYRVSFDSLKAFELDLHQHIHLENNILFPKAIELFGETKAALN